MKKNLNREEIYTFCRNRGTTHYAICIMSLGGNGRPYVQLSCFANNTGSQLENWGFAENMLPALAKAGLSRQW